MAQSPQENYDKMMKILNGWRTLAPSKSFGGMTLAEYETQVNKSLAPRSRLVELTNEESEQKALREAEDLVTFSKIAFIVRSVQGDPEHGEDSALYEAFGYVRKSERKSGLTRKKKKGDKTE